MGFKAVRAARVPLELGKLEGEEVVGRISKRCVTQAVQDDTNERSFIVSADADGEVVTEHCEYVWIKLLGGEDENNVQFFLNNFSYILYHVFSR